MLLCLHYICTSVEVVVRLFTKRLIVDVVFIYTSISQAVAF